MTHDPVLLIPFGKFIRAFNIAQFKPRTPPKFPADDLVYLTDQMRLEERQEQQDNPGRQPARAGATAGSAAQDEADGEGDDEDEDNGDGDGEKKGKDVPGKSLPTAMYPPPAPLAFLFDAVEGWDIQAVLQTGGPAEIGEITSCEVGFEGRVIVGLGEGILFIWRLKE